MPFVYVGYLTGTTEILSKIDNTPVADLPRMKIWQSVPQEARTPLALANAADAFRRDVEKALAMHGKLDDEKLACWLKIGKEGLPN
jgi:phosphoribosylformylglycinamidine (FGAM) synthase-like enzyme